MDRRLLTILLIGLVCFAQLGESHYYHYYDEKKNDFLYDMLDDEGDEMASKIKRKNDLFYYW
uniref:Uncharacterized LOC104266653 n=1 Tax=Ciona intestinalis TaxID=7719 RepID=F6Y6G8_CIOIN